MLKPGTQEALQLPIRNKQICFCIFDHCRRAKNSPEKNEIKNYMENRAISALVFCFSVFFIFLKNLCYQKNPSHLFLSLYFNTGTIRTTGKETPPSQNTPKSKLSFSHDLFYAEWQGVKFVEGDSEDKLQKQPQWPQARRMDNSSCTIIWGGALIINATGHRPLIISLK